MGTKYNPHFISKLCFLTQGRIYQDTKVAFLSKRSPPLVTLSGQELTSIQMKRMLQIQAKALQRLPANSGLHHPHAVVALLGSPIAPGMSDEDPGHQIKLTPGDSLNNRLLCSRRLNRWQQRPLPQHWNASNGGAWVQVMGALFPSQGAPLHEEAPLFWSVLCVPGLTRRPAAHTQGIL